jgi:hypothetical protein
VRWPHRLCAHETLTRARCRFWYEISTQQYKFNRRLVAINVLKTLSLGTFRTFFERVLGRSVQNDKIVDIPSRVRCGPVAPPSAAAVDVLTVPLCSIQYTSAKLAAPALPQPGAVQLREGTSAVQAPPAAVASASRANVDREDVKVDVSFLQTQAVSVRCAGPAPC